jgi:hypothetical protein
MIDKTENIKETCELKNNVEFEVIYIDKTNITIKYDRLYQGRAGDFPKTSSPFLMINFDDKVFFKLYNLYNNFNS